MRLVAKCKTFKKLPTMTELSQWKLLLWMKQLQMQKVKKVNPKSKKVTELKFSGRIQGQWDGIESEEVVERTEITFTSGDSF